jgi:hypothetical protein
VNVAPARPSNSRVVLPSFSRWALLNPYTARHTSSLAFGLVGFRAGNDRAQNTGYSLAFGEAVTTVRGGFLAGGFQEHELRLVPKDALSLSIARYQWEAGPRLGPIEPMARVGVTLAHLDYGHGFSFGMFSPRVGVGVWLKLPGTRIGVSAFTEYFWRWTGDDSAFVHGLTFEIQPMAKPLMRYHAPTSLPASTSRP